MLNRGSQASDSKWTLLQSVVTRFAIHRFDTRVFEVMYRHVDQPISRW